MTSSEPTFATRIRFPLIFGSALIVAYIAFANRRYFLRNVEEEAKVVFKQDPDGKRFIEQAKLEINR